MRTKATSDRDNTLLLSERMKAAVSTSCTWRPCIFQADIPLRLSHTASSLAVWLTKCLKLARPRPAALGCGIRRLRRYDISYGSGRFCWIYVAVCRSNSPTNQVEKPPLHTCLIFWKLRASIKSFMVPLEPSEWAPCYRMVGYGASVSCILSQVF